MKPKGSVKKTSPHPVISDTPGILGYSDTLENTLQLLELLEYIDLSEGMNKKAQFGLFLVLEMLIQSIQHVSDELKASLPE